jgi:flagellar protein FliO/FliZ
MSTMFSMLVQTPLASAPDINVGGELLRVVLSLGGVVALIFAAGWLSRRLQGRQLIGGRRLRCVETLSVGARERVVLLEADGKRLLVGIGAGGVRTLHAYEGNVPVAEIEPVAVPNFSELLGRWRRNA